MKTKFLAFCCLAFVTFFTACGDNKANVTPPGKMTEFMKMIDGTAQGVSNAYDTFASDSLKAANEGCMSDLCLYDLKNPKVTSVEGTCCNMEAEAGITTRSYKFCWNNDKISKLEFAGVK